MITPECVAFLTQVVARRIAAGMISHGREKSDIQPTLLCPTPDLIPSVGMKLTG